MNSPLRSGRGSGAFDMLNTESVCTRIMYSWLGSCVVVRCCRLWFYGNKDNYNNYNEKGEDKRTLTISSTKYLPGHILL